MGRRTPGRAGRSAGWLQTAFSGRDAGTIGFTTPAPTSFRTRHSERTGNNACGSTAVIPGVAHGHVIKEFAPCSDRRSDRFRALLLLWRSDLELPCRSTESRRPVLAGRVFKRLQRRTQHIQSEDPRRLVIRFPASQDHLPVWNRPRSGAFSGRKRGRAGARPSPPAPGSRLPGGSAARCCPGSACPQASAAAALSR